MKGEWKIPFKKLEWHSGVTEEGESKGFIYQIGELYQYRGRHPLRKYIVSNISGAVIKSISVWSTDDDKLLGEVTTLEEGKKLCQKDLESYIMKTFFESDGRAV
jgi:hypothetical protein